MTLYDIWQSDHAGDFSEGVALLVQHNPGAVTKAILARLQTLAATGDYVGNYENGKLTNALRATPAPADARHETPDARRETPTTSNQQPTTNNQQLTSDKAKELHKLHAHEHALMVTADNDEARAEHAAKIMEDILPALDREYDRLKGKQHSPPDGGGAGSGVNDDDDMRKLLSVRSRISTLRGKIKKATDPKKKAKWETELDIKIAERERLEAVLGC